MYDLVKKAIESTAKTLGSEITEDQIKKVIGGLSEEMEIERLRQYICDDNFREAYQDLLDVAEKNPQTPADEVVTIWWPYENEGWTVEDLLGQL